MAGALRAAVLLAALGLAALATPPAEARLRHAVQLPAESFDFVSWDPVLKQTPNRGSRRWGTTKLVETTQLVLRAYRDAHPDAPRVLIGDLSRRYGGWFGARYGGRGHASHQTGLDVDVYYPRRDRRERAARWPEQVDRALAQDLVDRFVEAGAIKVYVGPRVRLSGRRGVVTPLVYHDDHLHVRLSASRVNEPVAG
ncbi:MAG: penicillin-insensitive murein endopeptidase [Actinomycetota bacterium]|nr:penicillin-insensitive murein endopeptidase [Actinomycetota bacterium]